MNNSNKLFYYPDNLVSLSKQMEIALEPVINQREAINLAIQILNKPLVNNLTRLRETVNAYYSEPLKIANRELKKLYFTNTLESQQKLISESLKDLKFNIPTETLIRELPKLQEALITSKSYIPKDIQEEIELGFENQIKENNEILNNPFLDKEVVKNMVLNRDICFFITVFSIITPLITDKVTYQVVSNVIAYVYSELVRKYNIDKRNM